MFTHPKDVGGSFGFWFEMHVILLVRFQDLVVKRIISWLLRCLSPVAMASLMFVACCQGDRAGRRRGQFSSLWKR